ncbi:Protein transport protein yif1 [Saxophila tyrrhenica]|uniref:Protein YIF1 n=1 Tax=Saxophila tyrrhenica TaxID=1690608 RepID=A0AAV9PQZ0_9PEZI|nr:Protein transport protein yif1 [Saxophila tyrrhenica]
MQRPTYAVPPANSPPLHHPVPQHVSTVPQLRSPPLPVSQNGQQQQGGYGYGQPPPQPGQGGAQGSSYMHPAFGGFINDPTAQMGFAMGKSAVAAGQEYVEQNMNRFVNVSKLKHYFNVSNGYVMQKLLIVLFPWRHRPWSRQQARMGSNGQAAEFLPPREDVNSPGITPSLPFSLSSS